jgi:hypothetical protein
MERATNRNFWIEGLQIPTIHRDAESIGPHHIVDDMNILSLASRQSQKTLLIRQLIERFLKQPSHFRQTLAFPRRKKLIVDDDGGKAGHDGLELLDMPSCHDAQSFARDWDHGVRQIVNLGSKMAPPGKMTASAPRWERIEDGTCNAGRGFGFCDETDTAAMIES